MERVYKEVKPSADMLQVRCEIEDEFVDENFEKINQTIGHLEQMGFYGDPSVDRERNRGRIKYDNPSTRAFLKTVPTSEHWLSLVPTVKALDSLYNPVSETYANSQPTSPEARQWLSNCLDGVGIRSRAKVVKGIIYNETVERSKNTNDDTQILSLACGAAHPILEASSNLAKAFGHQNTHLTLVDYDKGALSLANKYAQDLGVNNVNLRRRNVLNPKGLTFDNSVQGIVKSALYRRSNLEKDSYDLVEAVGILEYLKPNDWSYKYPGVIERKQKMAGAVSLMKNSYELVKPGGLLMVGNMLDTHPQLGFTLNVIQWPRIQPRSINEMSDIFDKAGIDGERQVFLPEDGVYGIYVIRKPEN